LNPAFGIWCNNRILELMQHGVNATEMAKPIGKQVSDWLGLQSTENFLNKLNAVRAIPRSALFQIVKGGDPSQQGTWFLGDVAIEFARWLAPVFGIWCNDRILELMQHGVTAIRTTH